MIRITVELVSAISPDRSRVLGVAEIANEGATPEAPRMNTYRAKLSKWAPQEDESWKEGLFVASAALTEELVITQFDREQRGPWDLLYVVLKGLIGDRSDLPGLIRVLTKPIRPARKR